MENTERFFSVSVRGESHLQSGKPMQDYSIARRGEGYSVAVVCDGHGADKHFRSEVGAKCAALVALEKSEAFFKKFPTYDSLEPVKERAISDLKLGILAKWQSDIEAYTRANPFTKEELKKASAGFFSRRAYSVSEPYGTTLLAVLLTKSYSLNLMIGDGATVKIFPSFESEIMRFSGKKVYDDEPHAATDSLCEADAYKKMFVSLRKLCKAEEHVAYALCSDGLSEAFDTDETLLRKINNYLNYYAEEGLERALGDIGAQLTKLSKVSAMKDDISLAFATNSLERYDTRR